METWVRIKKYQDLHFERLKEGIAKITINRPEVRNAFRPQTIMELIDAFELCRADTSIGVVILTGQGPRPSARALTLKSVTMAMSVKVLRAPIFWTSKSKSARYRSPSLPWSQAMRSAAAMCCTWCATSRSPRKTRASAKPDQGWAPSMPDWAAAILRGSSGKKERVRSGFFAVSTTRPKR